jgi:tRNA U34 5-carboxymethylaminomethyl modifying enzyme MnmG/GidA
VSTCDTFTSTFGRNRTRSNAARFARGQEPVVFDRSTAYLGVMVDDLCRVIQLKPDFANAYNEMAGRAESLRWDTVSFQTRIMSALESASVSRSKKSVAGSPSSPAET